MESFLNAGLAVSIVPYTVCQRYGIETSDYSFGYIAGWSSGKETKELKSSLDTIRKTAAEMIEGIDAKLKVLLAEKAQSTEKDAEAPAEPMQEVPIYRETANYAYEAGELEAYRRTEKYRLRLATFAWNCRPYHPCGRSYNCFCLRWNCPFLQSQNEA